MNKIFISRYDYFKNEKYTNRWLVQLATPNKKGWTGERTIIGGSERSAIDRIKRIYGINTRCRIIRMNYGN